MPGAAAAAATANWSFSRHDLEYWRRTGPTADGGRRTVGGRNEGREEGRNEGRGESGSHGDTSSALGAPAPQCRFDLRGLRVPARETELMRLADEALLASTIGFNASLRVRPSVTVPATFNASGDDARAMRKWRFYLANVLWMLFLSFPCRSTLMQDPLTMINNGATINVSSALRRPTRCERCCWR